MCYTTLCETLKTYTTVHSKCINGIIVLHMFVFGLFLFFHPCITTSSCVPWVLIHSAYAANTK